MGDNLSTKNLTVLGNLNLQGATVTGLAFDKIAGLKTALSGKANLLSPGFAGTPTAPTALPGNNTAQLATTAFVQKAIADIGDNAPDGLNTLTQLATAIGLDANLSVTVTNSLASKAPIHNAGFTGSVGGIDKTMVGLGSVSNRSDEDLFISDATLNALALKLATGANQFAGNAGTVTNGVYTAGNQTIDGTKTFSNTIVGSISGNAATTTKLATIRTIAGNNFDGTSNINITYGNLSDGSTLATTSYVQNIVASPNVAIGEGAGYTQQQTGAVAIGYNAGYTKQGTQAVAIGALSGQYAQGSQAVAIGLGAGATGQAPSAVAIGANAGNQSQGSSAVSIGSQTPYTVTEIGDPGDRRTYVSNEGHVSQGDAAVAIGFDAGHSTQGQDAVAIGRKAGYQNQGQDAVAIGNLAGYIAQSNGAVAIGFRACDFKQGTQAIAIGAHAGGGGAPSYFNFTGSYQQHEHSIVINNITDTNFYSKGSGLFVGNIRNTIGDGVFSNRNRMVYDPNSKEVAYRYKSFVIDHPTDEDKYLVHACLEGPEAGVYYRGEGKIVDNLSTTIDLPDYVKHLATEFTVQLTRIYPGKKVAPLYAGRVKNNSFTVYGENCEFYWQVTGKRFDIEVEPSKDTTNVNGSGPYKWI
jgi:hypothetical protein